MPYRRTALSQESFGSSVGTAAGVYVLVLGLEQPTRLIVGRLGPIAFAPGIYGYVGSAFGPGGLAARTGRHIRGNAPCRWHIDYLRRVAIPLELWIGLVPRRREHDWAQTLGELAGVTGVGAGFGASDCRCLTHLFYFARRSPWTAFVEVVGRQWPEDSPLRRLLPAPRRRECSHQEAVGGSAAPWSALRTCKIR